MVMNHKRLILANLDHLINGEPLEGPPQRFVAHVTPNKGPPQVRRVDVVAINAAEARLLIHGAAHVSYPTGFTFTVRPL